MSNSQQDTTQPPQQLAEIMEGQIASMSPEWYQHKTEILTSTNVASVLEYSPYQSKREMFDRKVSRGSTLFTNSAMLWGIKYEPEARRLCAERVGAPIYETGLKTHQTHQFLGATPDGLFIHPESGIPTLAEFKCLKTRHMTQTIPLEYWVQMQIAMEVWDVDQCLYCENIFHEYSSQTASVADTRIPDNLKGHFPADQNNIGQDQAVHWALREWWDYLVKRDRNWFKTAWPKIRQFWNDVGIAQQLISSSPPSSPPKKISRKRKLQKVSTAEQRRRLIERPIKQTRKQYRRKTGVQRARVIADENPILPKKGASYHYREIDWTHSTRAHHLNAFLKNDPLLDWLQVYGLERGYPQDPPSEYQMQSFVFRQAQAFKDRLVPFLKTQLMEMGLPYLDVLYYPELEKVIDPLDIRYNYHSIYFLNRTKEAIQRQVPIIFNGLLYHGEAKIYGKSDLIIKEDLLHRVFPDAVLGQSDENFWEPAFEGEGGDRYVSLNLKYSILDLTSRGDALLSNEKQKFYQLQSLILSQALADLQGKPVEHAYLLSRKMRCRKLEIQSNNCLHNLFKLPVAQHPLQPILTNGLAWLDRVKREGAEWDPKNLQWPEVNKEEAFDGDDSQASQRIELANRLCPNMKNRYDYPWHQAKKELATQSHELTRVLNLGVRYRKQLIEEYGIHRWSDLHPEHLEAVRLRDRSLVAKIVETNLADQQIDLSEIDPDVYQPRHPQVEFYIDFETVSDLYDDLSKLPEVNGYDMIYLIGCLVHHHQTGESQYHCFIVENLTADAEQKMLQEFFDLLKTVFTEIVTTKPKNKKRKHDSINQARLAQEAYLYHWSHAEVHHLNKALERYQITPPVQLQFVDLYQIFKEHRITLSHCYNYGLKSVAKAFHRHGMIETTWKEGLNGAMASVGAWKAMDEATSRQIKLSETQTVQKLIDYNYNDCKVLQEMNDYLRDYIKNNDIRNGNNDNQQTADAPNKRKRRRRV